MIKSTAHICLGLTLISLLTAYFYIDLNFKSFDNQCKVLSSSTCHYAWINCGEDIYDYRFSTSCLDNSFLACGTSNIFANCHNGSSVSCDNSEYFQKCYGTNSSCRVNLQFKTSLSITDGDRYLNVTLDEYYQKTTISCYHLKDGSLSLRQPTHACGLCLFSEDRCQQCPDADPNSGGVYLIIKIILVILIILDLICWSVFILFNNEKQISFYPRRSD